MMAEVIRKLPNGHTIIIDDERRKTTFFLGDLYSYRLVDDSSDVVVSEGKWVANVDDLVYAYKLGWFRVARVDYTSYVVDLVLWEDPRTASEVGVDDVLLGVGPGYSSETWRAYLDTRVFPYRLDIDSRLHIYGSEANYLVVYDGINIGEDGKVISAFYTQSGDYVDNGGRIPLELVGTQALSVTVPSPIVENKAIKAPVMGYSHTALADGELVTAVVYNDKDAVISIAKLLVHNTNVVRHPDDGMLRVRSIELISPYLSKTEPNVLEIAINATAATLALRAMVTYTNGVTKMMDVVDEDANGKFMLLGLKYWSPSITGIESTMTLVYDLSIDEEYSFQQGETANGKVRETYRIRVMPNDPAFSLKLYAFPSWVSSQRGYELEYWLYDLNRLVARRCPKAAVTLADDSMAFDGLDYATNQHLKFSVDLGVVDAAWKGKTHAQSSQIQVLRDGGMQATNWRVKFAGNQPTYYGDNLMAPIHATGGGTSSINLKNGATTKAEWLEKLYYATQPVYDPETEVRAPEPTHFIITTKTRTFEVSVNLWATDITFVSDLTEGSTLYLQWIKKNATGALQLGVSGLAVHAV